MQLHGAREEGGGRCVWWCSVLRGIPCWPGERPGDRVEGDAASWRKESMAFLAMAAMDGSRRLGMQDGWMGLDDTTDSRWKPLQPPSTSDEASNTFIPACVWLLQHPTSIRDE